ncbi:MAG: winged helix DNA-binding domain-containing protein [Actinomycetota bacterium]
MARRIETTERRARLGRRHGLVERLSDPVAAADAMVVLHATDPATVFLSVLARVSDPSIEAIETALYDDRSLVRTLAMRRTLFVASREVLPAVEGSSTPAVAGVERKRLEDGLAAGGVDEPALWLSEAADEISAALGPDGAPARELTKLVPRLSTRILMGRGTKHPLESGATSRTLGVLANDGMLVRGRPGGNWTGRMYTWQVRADWLGEEPPPPDPAEARAELVRRWLATFGPGTMTDLKWWTKWKVAEVTEALAATGAVHVDLEDGTGWVLPDDVDPVEPGPAWAALLPSLDPTPMGWKERDWFLGPHEAPLFDRNGNIGPTVWIDGRIVGGWSQRPNGEIVTELLEDVGTDHRALVDVEAERLAACIGDTVVKPSFPTPLQKQLSEG